MNITRIFFVADLHGSDLCFRKSLSAVKIYKANVLIIGGDLTGKAIVPIVENPDGSYTASFLGMVYALKTREELANLEKKISSVGYYPYCTAQQEFEELSANETKINELFLQLMSERVRSWIKMAEERSKADGVKFFMLPGNDDVKSIDSIIDSSEYVINPEGKVLYIDNKYSMISTGYSNITPWNCPRDIPESELAQKIETMVSRVENLKDCIFCFHCPPHDTGIDMAPKLEDLKPVMSGGQLELVPVGSVAVRAAIEKYQPLLGLHGHIHESRGIYRLGHTLCVNPGSEYTEGVLRGVIVNLDEKGLRGYTFTSG